MAGSRHNPINQADNMNNTRMRKGTIMKRTTALALLGLACLMAMPSIAQARYRDGMNLYQYVGSNPVAYTDPTGLHRDFNPNGPRPKAIPRHGMRHPVPVSRLDSNTMHISFYTFYTRMRFFTWKDGSSGQYVLLRGNFLLDVQGQSEHLKFNKTVDTFLNQDARIMLCGLKCDRKDTFSDRGSRLITADLLSTNVRLSLQRYTVYWEAQCSIGPKKCNVWMDECDDKCGSKAAYGCDISWTLYDYYDFRGLTHLVFGTIGNPFHIYGYWSGAASGTVTSCKNE